LARFLINRRLIYYLVVERVKIYLYGTNYYTLQLGGGNEFKFYINIFFTNNINNRKSL
ncbi:hypothetical protein NEUTE1DRAFT_42286, partial [Neurospora tetrasperma FGSC 2508]